MIFIKKIFISILRFPIQMILFFMEWIVSFLEFITFKIISRFKKPEFIRKGQCQSTGQCCRAIGMEFPKSWFRFPWIIRIVTQWHRLRYNFNYLGTNHNMLVYECNYLTAENKCGIHKVKPKLCRDFPQQPFYGFIKLHKGCGYYFEKHDGKDFGRVLKDVVEKQIEL